MGARTFGWGDVIPDELLAKTDEYLVFKELAAAVRAWTAVRRRRLGSEAVQPPPPKKGADLLGDLLAPTETKADPFADPFASPPQKDGGTFKIDVMAAAFGSCVCGRPKGDHIGAELRCPPVKEDPFSGL